MRPLRLDLFAHCGRRTTPQQDAAKTCAVYKLPSTPEGASFGQNHDFFNFESEFSVPCLGAICSRLERRIFFKISALVNYDTCSYCAQNRRNLSNRICVTGGQTYEKRQNSSDFPKFDVPYLRKKFHDFAQICIVYRGQLLLPIRRFSGKFKVD